MRGGTRLDVSAAGDGEHELWLVQLPANVSWCRRGPACCVCRCCAAVHVNIRWRASSGAARCIPRAGPQFDTSAHVEWEVSPDAADGFRGRCAVGGQEYLLVPEPTVGATAVYATPASPDGEFVPVARRLTVLRTTGAPQLCFGQANGIDATTGGDLSAEDAAVLVRRAAQLARPRPAAAAAGAGATPKRDGAVAPTATGAEGSEQRLEPAGAQQQQEQQGLEKKKKEKKEVRLQASSRQTTVLKLLPGLQLLRPLCHASVPLPALTNRCASDSNPCYRKRRSGGARVTTHPVQRRKRRAGALLGAAPCRRPLLPPPPPPPWQAGHVPSWADRPAPCICVLPACRRRRTSKRRAQQCDAAARLLEICSQERLSSVSECNVERCHARQARAIIWSLPLVPLQPGPQSPFSTTQRLVLSSCTSAPGGSAASSSERRTPCTTLRRCRSSRRSTRSVRSASRPAGRIDMPSLAARTSVHSSAAADRADGTRGRRLPCSAGGSGRGSVR